MAHPDLRQGLPPGPRLAESTAMTMPVGRGRPCTVVPSPRRDGPLASPRRNAISVTTGRRCAGHGTRTKRRLIASSMACRSNPQCSCLTTRSMRRSPTRIRRGLSKLRARYRATTRPTADMERLGQCGRRGERLGGIHHKHDQGIQIACATAGDFHRHAGSVSRHGLAGVDMALAVRRFLT